jgi:hypothetical protein
MIEELSTLLGWRVISGGMWQQSALEAKYLKDHRFNRTRSQSVQLASEGAHCCEKVQEASAIVIQDNQK